MQDSTNEKRKRVLEGGKRVRFRLEWLIPVAVVLAGVLFFAWPRNPDGRPRTPRSASQQRLRARDGEVLMPIADFADGKAQYFSYKFPEKTVHFFVLKSSDGIIRAAFDACDVCFRAQKGYQQKGDLMVCRNCGQVFPSVRINVEEGGCNPAPLQRATRGDQIVIKVTDIYTGLKYF